MRPILTALFVFSLFVTTCVAKEIPTATPEDVGMSSAQLAKIDDVVKKLLAEKQFAGTTVYITKDGKSVYFKSFGKRDIASSQPMENDTIVRIYSMSKLITSVAALILHDEGKLDLEAPVSKYLPEMKNVKVYQKNGNPTTPKREMTVSDLMRHTAGLAYGIGAGTPVDRLYRENQLLGGRQSLAQMVTKLSKLPLESEPGSRWKYSLGLDVLGRVIEVASGESFDTFLEKRIFKPLEMQDTAFYVTKDKVKRFATCYTRHGEKLVPKDVATKSHYLHNPLFCSGGGGLVSTARDYMRFLLMIQNDGELYGTRILSKDAVKLIKTNQMPKGARGMQHSLGCAITPNRLGGTAEYQWGGAAATHYWTRPKEKLTVVIMQQRMPQSQVTKHRLHELINTAVKQ